tara:strand:+ start:12489 stop:13010 length:522 start_codon:yes stop_codon:yes gene_type:complete
MDKALKLLVDKQAIYEILVRYCRGADRCDEALIRSIYHEDAYDDHGYWKGTGYDFAKFLPVRLMAANLATTHSITNVLIDIEGDSAVSESQVMATLVRHGRPLMADVMGARYLDRLSCRNGRWGIDERTVVLDWHKVETWESGDAPVPLDEFVRGGRGATDPIYRMIATGTLR